MSEVTFSQSVGHKFQKLDLLSSPVQLTVNGRSSYQTMTGATLSVIMLTAVFVYGSIIILSESRKPYTFTTTSFEQPLELEDGKFNPADYDLFPWFFDPEGSLDFESVTFSGTSSVDDNSDFQFTKCMEGGQVTVTELSTGNKTTEETYVMSQMTENMYKNLRETDYKGMSQMDYFRRDGVCFTNEDTMIDRSGWTIRADRNIKMIRMPIKFSWFQLEMV